MSNAQWKHTTELRTPPYSVELETDICTLQFQLPNDIEPPVFLYYRLTNFYQNHRRYVKSLDYDQLRGKFVSNRSMDSSQCSPLKKLNDIAIYPCGLIANSIFNDTINSPVIVSSRAGQSQANYSMTNKGIAWESDIKLYRKTAYTNDEVVPPPNWARRYPGGRYTDQYPIPNLSEYEEFAVWMRTAGLPTFSKLARRNDNDKMPAGTYQLEIYDCKLPNSYRQAFDANVARLPSQRIRWYQELAHLDTDCHRRKE